MTAREIMKNDDLMKKLMLVSRNRGLKLHNNDMQYAYFPSLDKFGKYSLYDVYKNPSSTKKYFDEQIRYDIENVFGATLEKWSYSGSCMKFSMGNVIEYESTKYRLTFTADYLHVIGYDK